LAHMALGSLRSQSAMGSLLCILVDFVSVGP